MVLNSFTPQMLPEVPSCSSTLCFDQGSSICGPLLPSDSGPPSKPINKPTNGVGSATQWLSLMTSHSHTMRNREREHLSSEPQLQTESPSGCGVQFYTAFNPEIAYHQHARQRDRWPLFNLICKYSLSNKTIQIPCQEKISDRAHRCSF